MIIILFFHDDNSARIVLPCSPMTFSRLLSLVFIVAERQETLHPLWSVLSLFIVCFRRRDRESHQTDRSVMILRILQ